MSNRGNGGDLLIALMDALDVDTAFGVVSVHNLPLVDAIARHRRFVPVRNEASAVNAADGYGRARGSLGIAITSTGTGAGNAAGALIEALSSSTSVLHVTGQIDSQYLGQGRGFIHETKDQLGMLQAVSKAAYTVDTCSSAVAILARAALEAISAPCGPVSVEWPIDLQYPLRDVEPFNLTRRAPLTPPHDDVAAAAELIATARRPLLWVGGGANRARAEVEELVDLTRAGVLTSNSGRGILHDGHGSSIGNFATRAECQDLLARSDLLVSIGTHFRSNETRDYRLELPQRQVQIDIDPSAIGRVYPAEVGVVGDAAVTLSQILELLPDRTATEDSWLTEVMHARRAVRFGLRDEIGWQAELSDAVQSAFPPSAVIARDVTIPSSTWGNRLLSMTQPENNIFPRGGGIGQGLGMGIGSAIARSDMPTLVMAGDGGLAVNLGELATLAQEGPWLVLMVFNDRGYGVLRNTQDNHFETRSGVDLLTPDFGALANAFGIPHWRVDSLDNIEDTLAAALQKKGPAVVEIDVDALGPMPTPFVPPVTIPTE